MAGTKDIVYVDVDDEITTLIDKVRLSSGKVVILVLPKKASILQSIVNMKLLKRSAEKEKKNIVLITSESGIISLAGAVGLYVAANLNDAPRIPPVPNKGSSLPDTVEEDSELNMSGNEEIPDLVKNVDLATSVGALTELAKSQAQKPDSTLETLDLDNDSQNKSEISESQKKSKDKNLKVPNFDRFRFLLISCFVLVIGIIVLVFFAFEVWPHAYITVDTNASNVNTSLNISLDTQSQSVNITAGDIPAREVSQQKTFSQTVNTTGQANQGNSATGSVTFSGEDCPNPSNNLYAFNDNSFVIPQGTGLSYKGLTYITDADTTMTPKQGFQQPGNCVDYVSTYTNANGSTPISAQSPGSNYNTPNNVTFSVSGYSEFSATGSASGGTDNIVSIVSQTDVNNAVSKINSNDSSLIEQALSNQLKGEGLYPIDATFSGSKPQISPNPSVGAQSNTVSVTETITYTMFGASMKNIDAVVDSNIRSQTSSNQNIINNGINQSAFKQQAANGLTDQVLITSLAEVGPNISVSTIKKEVAGKSPQAIISAIKNNPNVTKVSVRLSPFWVSSAPSSLSKITVKIAKPTNR